MTNPGNNSGKSNSKGKVIISGPSILKKERIIISKFKIPFRFGFFNLSSNTYPKVISKQPIKDDPAIAPILMTKLKSTKFRV